MYELHLVTSDVACRLFEFIRHFSVLASSATLVAIAAERYIAVCQIGTKLNVNNINVGVWIVLGVSCILAGPSVGTFAVVRDLDVKDIKCRFPHEFTTGKFCHFTYEIMGKAIVTAYQALILMAFIISCFIMGILYSIIYIVLWRKSKLRQKMTSRSSVVMETDSNVETSCTEQCQQAQHEPSRNQTCRSCFVIRRYFRMRRFETNAQNSDILDELATNNLIQQQDARNPPEDSSDSEIKSKVSPKNDRDSVRPKQTARKKIKFSISAQSGRSEKLKRKRHYHRRTAKMLFLCTVIFVITWLPFWFDIFGLTNCLILRYLFFIGNASNPIVYGIVNDQVRRAFKRLFFDCVKRWFRLEDQSDNGQASFNLSGTIRREADT